MSSSSISPKRMPMMHDGEKADDQKGRGKMAEESERSEMTFMKEILQHPEILFRYRCFSSYQHFFEMHLKQTFIVLEYFVTK
ncbi:hypothetical protein CEXT_540371 [Caerostris extrusa]|uniref:Uncharacterized protein n=1 Tax=Caerostris extrusa TaxID=172846 RepID=A0AAV4QII3_CAEEX|nr:hypothetical protein CEXT_540371 [Caerostris extrusa]